MNEQSTIENKDELVRQELKDILSARPHWFVRKGNSIILLILLMLLFIAWLLPYPNAVHGSNDKRLLDTLVAPLKNAFSVK